MIAAFQRNAFQNNAFQIGSAGVGWMPEWRRRHDSDELERRLKDQKGFSRKWFEDYVAAEAAARERIGKAEIPEQRSALEAAVEETAARIEEIAERGPPSGLIRALRGAALATSAVASIKYAELASELATKYAPRPRPRPPAPEPPDEYAAIRGQFSKEDMRKLEREATAWIDKIDHSELERLENEAIALVKKYLH